MRILLLLPILLLAACGQSGDLYLPPKEPPAETVPQPAPPPTPEEPKEKK